MDRKITNNNFRFAHLMVLMLLLVPVLIFAAEFIDNSQAAFDNGTFFQTFFNISTSSIELNISTPFSFGNFTSQIFDATGAVGWTNLTWCGVGNDGSPNFVSLSCEGSLNMSDARLLMHMNEGSGTIFDTSGNGNNGSYNGALYSQSGKIATSIGFDGINDFINITEESDFDFERTDAFSIAFWANIEDDSNDNFVIAKEGSFGASFFGWSVFTSNGRGDSLNFELFGNSSDTNRSVIFGDIDVVDSEWHHLAVVKEAGTGVAAEMSVYVDGVKDTTNILDNDLGTTSILNNFAVTIGSRDNAGIPTEGEIDEVLIFARNISLEEIQQLYRRGVVELNLSVRSCNDENCTGETFSNLGNVATPVTLAVSDNQFFQYKYDFSTSDLNYTPQINNVTIMSGGLTPVPVISDEASGDITDVSANITWNTDIVSNSSVDFGITLGLGSSTSQDDSVLNHSVILTSLDGNTTYFFNVTSCTVTGCDTTGPFTFTTFPTSEQAAVAITSIFVETGLVFTQEQALSLKGICFADSTPTGYCSTGNNCTMTIFDPDDNVLINRANLTNEVAFYNLDLTAGQTNDTGTYSGTFLCKGTNQDQTTFTYQITPTGTLLSTSGGLVYIITLLAALVIFGLSLTGAILIPWRNTVNENDRVININQLKWVKLFLWYAAYFELMFIFGILENITGSFLILTGTSGFFSLLFNMMLAIAVPITLGVFIIIVIYAISDIKLQKALARGLPTR